MSIYSKKYIVQVKDTAKFMGSGDLDVLATPALVCMAENTAKRFIQQKLRATQTSVGVSVELKHIQPSKVGTTIQITIVYVEEEQGKYTLKMDIFDQSKPIAFVTHKRVVVETNDFLRKINEMDNFS